jgi:hypothetical protein
MLEIGEILQERERKRRLKRNEQISKLNRDCKLSLFKITDFDANLLEKRAERVEKLKELLREIDLNLLKLTETIQSIQVYSSDDDSFLKDLQALPA